MDPDGQNIAAYDLFLRIAKSLAMKLPFHKQRIIAAKWIRKIDSLIDMDEMEKAKFLKLISISMQSKMLVGPFQNEPPQDDYNIMNIYRLRPVDIKSMVVDDLHSASAQPHPYFSEISGDLKEYLVYQEIPDFGSHFYYACSPDPITNWVRSKFTILPKGGFETTIMIPPIAVISKSKEEYVKAYQLYLEKSQASRLNKNCGSPTKGRRLRTATDTFSKHCSKTKEKPPKIKTDCDNDSADEYVDYQLIGQGASVDSPPTATTASDSTNHTDEELPTRISFFVGDDPEPFLYQLTNKESQNDKQPDISKEDKIRALACEYITLGVLDNERDALLKAKEFLTRIGCI